ncbi:MAG TPA: asparagine synthase (glutamine-hydrolyzing) [Streptosporangiaceae bacterium]
MCGIAGTCGFGDGELVRAMTDAIAHRGPDGEGFYDGDGVHLGNRRLAIQDVPGGAQPMANEDGSVVVVYNGEIYNYPQLRDVVLARGHRLKTHCDTEILAHLYEDEGIDFAARLNGIFAFALYDLARGKLFLVRDPLGVKPLVYAVRDGKLAFGSEAKAVLASGLVGAELDETSLHLTMNVRYVPGSRTFFRGIRRLPPGHALEFAGGQARLRPYAGIDWTPDTSVSRGEWLEGIRFHYGEAVRRQLLSDVPVGVSLSGGIDSSSIVAMLRRAVSGPIKTFSLGFDEPTDETGDARFVAQTFETEHQEVVLHEPALDYLGDAIWHTEEPKVNSLQLYLLHRFIGEHVSVVLSGLGGDELFAGYDFYSYLLRARRLRSGAAGAAVRALAPALDWSARRAAGLGRPQLDLATRKLEWLAASGSRNYLLLRNAWDFNPALLRRVYTPEFAAGLNGPAWDDYAGFFADDRPLESQALRAEFATKMVCDLLHNEDTMSMAHSVESRVPLLDLELVRFAARIPDDIRFGGGPKGLLKEALTGVLPDRVLHKRKWGFTFDPVEQYQKDLGPMVRDMLSPDRLRQTGIFNPQFVQAVLKAQPHQRLRWHYFLLWQMIGVETWLTTFAQTGAPRRRRSMTR